MRRRDILRRVPGFRRLAEALDRLDRLDGVTVERNSLLADNDRLKRLLFQLAFHPNATDGEDGGRPLPSEVLRFLVAAGQDAPEPFLRLGRLGAEGVGELVARHGRPFGSLGRVLDFGCGCGRTLRHLVGVAGVEWHGCDANPHAINWCRTHLAPGRFEVNSIAPPVPYPDAHFGLVYAFSVFTHLTADLQARWLDEFRRVIRPDGLLLVSTHGDVWRPILRPDEGAEYDAGRLVVRMSDLAGGNDCAAFHPPAYFRTALGSRWAVVEHLPQGAKGNVPQDAWLLRRQG